MRAERNTNHFQVDVSIVGGGPAGLAAAICLCERGHEVCVVERRSPPLDKACGEGLMPPAVQWLQRHGVRLRDGAGYPFVGIRYMERGRAVEGLYRSSFGLGLRRTVLHEALSKRAGALGARLMWGVEARSLSQEGLQTSAGMIRARWVIGADGLHSRVRRWAGLEGSAPCRQRFGRRRHYQIPPWTDHVEVYWTDAMEAYVTPISAREVGVAILGPAEPHSFNALLLRFPTLLERLKEAPAVSTVRGAGPLRQSARAVGHDNVLLIGDAAGYVDAITGEGIAVAFAQAEALAASLETQSRESELRDRAAVLRRYVRAHARIVRRPDRMTRMVLLLSERRRLRRLVLATLGRWPNLFDRALAFMAASNRSGC